MAAQPKRASVFDRPHHLRRRLRLSVFLLLAGLLAIAFALVPQPWRDMIAAALGVALGWLASLGALVIALALGVGLLLAATLLLVVPHRERPQAIVPATSDAGAMEIVPGGHLLPSSTLVQVNGIAPVSVYLDLENQVSGDQVVQFVAAVREYVGHRASELYFYSNAAATASHKVYKALWKYGFRPIDVPYKHLGVRSAKNIVDVDLSLHAYHRAVFGPANQDILLITEDQDYLPLVFRLHALGHRVTIWASRLPESYKQLKDLLGVNHRELGSEFGKPAPAPKQTAGAKRAAPKSPRLAAGKPVVAQAHPPQSPPTAITLYEAISWVPRIMDRIPDDSSAPFGTLTARLGSIDGDILARLGHRPAHRSQRVLRWLEQMNALGMIELHDRQHLPTMGGVTADEAAQTLERFLAAVAGVVIARAQRPEGDCIPLAEACLLVTQSSTTQDDDYSGLRRLIAPAEPMPRTAIGHMRHLLETAQVLGMLTFENTENPDVIRVILPTAPGA
ncbi:MAG TPA: NYN domain-containing protein [Ktedonobacterales bacterium]|nr:NYN domain-containing protein [Ktedonobacterales bacterium]